MFLVLVQNTALLVALIAVYTVFHRRVGGKSSYYLIISGLLFGALAIFGIMMPFTFAPGVIFDGRSLVLSLAGLFGGPVTGMVAAILAAAYRMWLGGAGSLVGAGVSFLSVLFGIIFYSLRRRYPRIITPLSLLGFGFVVHLAVLALFIGIPGMSYLDVINHLALPVLLIYPPATVMIGFLFLDHESRLAAEEKTRLNELRNRALVNAIPDAMFRYSREGVFLDAEIKDDRLLYPKVSTLYRKKQLVDQKIQDVMPPDIANLTLAAIDKAIETRAFQVLEYSYLVEGELRYKEARLVSTGTNEVVAIVRDITESKRIEAELRFLSLHDSLTGLHNRAYFDNEINRLEGAREYPIAIISADLDWLKMTKDKFGHQVGDKLLQACAKILQGSLRSSDISARIGGDEFVIIMPRTDKLLAEKIIGRINYEIALYNQLNPDLLLSISLGFAVTENKDQLLIETYKKADLEMYHAKTNKIAKRLTD
ncbi:MAG TPA: diguanylate cyclase [Candidatus Limnocylindrales bacterium]|nr:diguanylate cyclase [Candidatus Limnocylindrales bacterium]